MTRRPKGRSRFVEFTTAEYRAKFNPWSGLLRVRDLEGREGEGDVRITAGGVQVSGRFRRDRGFDYATLERAAGQILIVLADLDAWDLD